MSLIIPSGVNNRFTTVRSLSLFAILIWILSGSSIRVSGQCTAPVILQQPVDFKDVCDKSYVDFSASASGTPVPTVQWQVSTNNGSTWTNLVNSGTAVTGATGNLLSLYVTKAFSGNLYRAVYSNSCGTATTNTSRLSVTDGVFINVDAVQTGGDCNGGEVTLYAQANSHKNITGQWQYFDGTQWQNIGPSYGPQNGVLKMDYTFTPDPGQDGLLFRLYMRGNCGDLISTAVFLRVDLQVNTLNTCAGAAPVTFTHTGNEGGEWSVSGGGTISDSGIFTPTTPGCYTATYTNVSPDCSSTAGFIVYPAAPSAPVVTSGYGLFTVTPPESFAGFTIQYSFDDGNTWGENTPPTEENVTGYRIRTRYVPDGTCGVLPAASASNVPDCQVSPVTIRMIDQTAPAFDAPVASLEFCVDNLISAAYVSNNLQINPVPDYYLFGAGTTVLDLDSNALNFYDNLFADEQLTIHWRLDFSATPDPSDPSKSLAHASVTGSGQPSAFGSGIHFPGDGVNFSTVNHTITYWLTDPAGNISTEHSSIISIKPRPYIVAQ